MIGRSAIIERVDMKRKCTISGVWLRFYFFTANIVAKKRNRVPEFEFERLEKVENDETVNKSAQQIVRVVSVSLFLGVTQFSCALFRIRPTDMCEWFSSFDTVYTLLHSTSEMCTSSAPLRWPLVCDSHGRNTSDRNRPHRSMCRCTGGHAFPEYRVEDFVCKIQATFPGTRDLYYLVACDLDCTVSIGNDICKRSKENIGYTQIMYKLFSSSKSTICKCC